MNGFKPNHEIWRRVNEAILGESAADVVVTLISGLCSLMIAAGVVPDERTARVHVAAMLLSPDDSTVPGSLLPMLQRELDRLKDGRWLQ